MIEVYVDMDGVLCDFFGDIAKLYNKKHWKEFENFDEVLKEVAETDFFQNLSKFESTDRLIEYVHEKTDGNWCILSKPLIYNVQNTTLCKIEWLTQNLKKQPNRIHFSFEKEKFSGTDKILIDDSKENIKFWNAEGGIGILYQANEMNVKDLIKTLENVFENHSF